MKVINVCVDRSKFKENIHFWILILFNSIKSYNGCMYLTLRSLGARNKAFCRRLGSTKEPATLAIQSRKIDLFTVCAKKNSTRYSCASAVENHLLRSLVSQFSIFIFLLETFFVRYVYTYMHGIGIQPEEINFSKNVEVF